MYGTIVISHVHLCLQTGFNDNAYDILVIAAFELLFMYNYFHIWLAATNNALSVQKEQRDKKKFWDIHCILSCWSLSYGVTSSIMFSRFDSRDKNGVWSVRLFRYAFNLMIHYDLVLSHLHVFYVRPRTQHISQRLIFFS